MGKETETVKKTTSSLVSCSLPARKTIPFPKGIWAELGGSTEGKGKWSTYIIQGCSSFLLLQFFKLLPPSVSWIRQWIGLQTSKQDEILKIRS